ncbi:MAG: EAL domain-containing protein [Lachnospiraceae bacterium]|nr:EAL domain-containing protein [Lachnospiraceae bacterium]
MSNVIGVCVTRVQGEMCRTFLGSLLKNAKKAGFKICVFQSVYDFDEQDESGAGYIFDSIPFSELCAVIILHDTIYDKAIKDRIVDGANSAGIPVIMARDIYPGCISLVGSFDDVYYKLISDVIDKNNLKDVYYIGGRQNSGVDSKRRIEVFRKVCSDKNIDFDDSKIGYGQYYEVPTYRIIDSLTEGGKKPPRGIFCANDIMALAVIERLEENGYKVPEDTVVVGFDGSESAKYSEPSLTTCCENMENISVLAIDVIKKAIKGDVTAEVYKYDFSPAYAASAGYDEVSDKTGGKASLEIFRRFRSDEADEEASNIWIDSIMTSQDLFGYKNVLPNILTKQRYIYARPESFWKFSDGEGAYRLPERLIYYKYNDEGALIKGECELDNIIKDSIRECKADEATYISAISMHNVVFGIAVDHSSDPFNEGGRLNRFALTLDRGLSLAISGERQLYLADKINKSRYIDSLSGMLNADGASRFYKNYINDEEARHTYMLIGTYTIISYAELLKEYGTDFLEDCIKFVSGTLKEMNPDCRVIARISSASFMVGYVFEDEHNSSKEIEVTINNFFTAIETKRLESESWDKLEVSCGYISDEHQECDSLEGYINAAIATMYRNRAAIHENAPKVLESNSNDGPALLEYRRKVVRLIENDLFIYHFQPIVSAKTGEIVAYEALMRTDESIGMSPTEVLQATEMFDKYADLESATFYHIFRRVKNQLSDFEGKKVFINTVPGHFLSECEVGILRNNYGDLLDIATIELTESRSVTHEEIDAIRHLSSPDKANDIAVDDYGMGHSNIVNLLEYRPQVVKIDRYLISNIQNDRNKQLFVKNLIEFASGEHIKVLAEGVETSEELRTVIEFGVDLIQGYYTARPTFEVVQRIDSKIEEEIKKAAEARKACK